MTRPLSAPLRVRPSSVNSAALISRSFAKRARGVAVIFTALPELLRSFGDLEVLVYGVSLVLVLLFFPRGLGGTLDWAIDRIRARGKPGGRGRTA